MKRICCRFAVTLACMLAFTLTSGGFADAQQQKLPQPVRMGSGNMTFDTVPGWGLRPDGSSAIGTTHGSVVIGTGEVKQ